MYKIIIIILLLFLILFNTKQNYYKHNLIIKNNFKESVLKKDTIYMYFDENGNSVISNKWHNKSEVINLNDVNMEIRRFDNSEIDNLYFLQKNDVPKSLNKRQSILIEELKYEQEQYIKEKNILAKIDEKIVFESDIGYQNYVNELKQNLEERKNNIEMLKKLLNIK
jgi:hypothetical protein